MTSAFSSGWLSGTWYQLIYMYSTALSEWRKLFDARNGCTSQSMTLFHPHSGWKWLIGSFNLYPQGLTSVNRTVSKCVFISVVGDVEELCVVNVLQLETPDRFLSGISKNLSDIVKRALNRPHWNGPLDNHQWTILEVAFNCLDRLANNVLLSYTFDCPMIILLITYVL